MAMTTGVTRRDMLSGMTIGAATLGTAMLAGNRLLAQGERSNGPGSVMPTKGKITERPLPTNPPSKTGKYRPTYRLGLGGVAIGNAFAETSDRDAEATLEAVWMSGARYFDTSPWYGLGLSERRFGMCLHNHQPDEYVLSTKVGRLLKAAAKPPENLLWKSASAFGYRYDYTAEGVRRSIEDSLQRLGVPRIDIVFIHDLSSDNQDMGDKWTEYFEIAAKGAMPELTKMRQEGLIKAWGLGVNTPEPALKTIEVAEPDVFLLATQYSLIDHEKTLHHTFPALAKRDISVVVGSPLNAGYLAGRERYNYRGEIPPEAAEKRKRMTAIADEHGIDLRTAALQFCAAHPVVSAVIPGARNAEQAAANASSIQVAIPDEFWAALRRERLIAEDAPVPKAG